MTTTYNNIIFHFKEEFGDPELEYMEDAETGEKIPDDWNMFMDAYREFREREKDFRADMNYDLRRES